MTTENTTLAAWKMAIKNRPVKPGLIFHSDRGVQYAAVAFRVQLDKHQVVQSMSRKGNCWDNAAAESFFKTLKAEIGYDTYFQTANQARITLFEFIEIWYNRQRIHSSIGYRTPAEMYMHLNQIHNLSTA